MLSITEPEDTSWIYENRIREAKLEALVKTKVSGTMDQKLVEWMDRLIKERESERKCLGLGIKV